MESLRGPIYWILFASAVERIIVRVSDNRQQLVGRMQDAGFRMQDAGCRMQDAGCRMQDAGCRMQDTGCRMQDAGYRMQSTDHWDFVP